MRWNILKVLKRVLVHLKIANRYLYSEGDKVITYLTNISLWVIILGVAASIVVMSVTNGFNEDIKSKVLGKESHLLMIARDGYYEDYEGVAREVEKFLWVRRAIPFSEGEALLLSYRDRVFGTLVRAVSEKDFQFFKNFLQRISGEMELRDGGILLAESLAINLGVSVGDTVTLVVAKTTGFFGKIMIPKPFRLKVIGIFSTGYAEYDKVFSIISLPTAEKIYGTKNIVWAIGIYVDNPEKAGIYRWYLYSKFGKGSQILTWMDINRNLFIALHDQKVIMAIVMFFFFVVVGFAILGSMISLVLDKKREIAILKAMGYTPTDIMQIFIYLGSILSLRGALIGTILGVFVSLNLGGMLQLVEDVINLLNDGAYRFIRLYKFIPRPEKFQFFKSYVYYIQTFPVKVEFGDLVFVFLLAVLISVLATLLPAYNASKMRPAEIIRNE